MVKSDENSVIVRESQQVVATMSVNLRQAYEEIREKLAKVTVSDIVVRYEIGEIIDTVMGDMSQYGSDAAQKLATALDISVAALYQCRKVACVWKRKELTRALERAVESSGYCLTWAHVLALATVPKPELRNNLLERAFDERLSAREVRAIITSLLGVRNNNPDGRPRVAPKSPAAGLAALRKLTVSVVNAQSVFEESVFDRLVESPAEFASESIIEQLREAQEDQLRLETAAKNNRLKLQAAMESIERELQAKSGKEPAAVSMTVGDEFLPQPRERNVAPTAVSTSMRVKKAADVLARLRAKRE